MAPRAQTKTTEPGGPTETPAGRGAEENLGLLVGQNMKRLRQRRNLSLEAVSKLSGVSRAMLNQIELARSVPTINVVWKIASAFGVPFSTLITARDVERMRVMPVSQTKVLTSASGAFSSRALFPFDGERRTEFYEIRLAGGCVENAEAHAPGTMENLVVASGCLEITVENEIQRLSAGDAILFQADKVHSYRNPQKQEAVAYLVMTYVDIEH
ncbi:MAG TPA: XRE family transcriptional regulator [Alphaproteobacteria bacterium]|nr:XRE family transcriptional regulator [Alphaproteobacteria bacterium]